MALEPTNSSSQKANPQEGFVVNSSDALMAWLLRWSKGLLTLTNDLSDTSGHAMALVAASLRESSVESAASEDNDTQEPTTWEQRTWNRVATMSGELQGELSELLFAVGEGAQSTEFSSRVEVLKTHVLEIASLCTALGVKQRFGNPDLAGETAGMASALKNIAGSQMPSLEKSQQRPDTTISGRFYALNTDEFDGWSRENLLREMERLLDQIENLQRLRGEIDASPEDITTQQLADLLGKTVQEISRRVRRLIAIGRLAKRPTNRKWYFNQEEAEIIRRNPLNPPQGPQTEI